MVGMYKYARSGTGYSSATGFVVNTMPCTLYQVEYETYTCDCRCRRFVVLLLLLHAAVGTVSSESFQSDCYYSKS